ncbi:MAG: protein translocase component YidC, partial [Candidatus Thermofonsia bacterium]
MWDTFIINPMTNALLLLLGVLGNNLILAITVFTVLLRLATLPLNIRQQRSMMKTQKMQPQIRAIQQKYKDNPQKMQEEFAKIGYNPAESLAGCLPMLIQMPILFGLFQVLRFLLGTTPQSVFELSQRASESFLGLFNISLNSLLPIDSHFLWLNLGQPDPLFILPILVFVTMFIQSKYTTPSAAKQDDNDKKKGQQQDDPAAAMNKQMQYMMPVMFGFFSLQFQAGLSIYFVLSNIIGIGQGLYVRRLMANEPDASGANGKVTPPPSSADKAVKAVAEKSEKETGNGRTETTENKPQHTARKPTSKRKRRSA